jgi:hypothetical protein
MPQTAPTPSSSQEQREQKPKEYTSLRAWQVGHDLNLEAHGVLQDYINDERIQPWCDSVCLSLRDSVVQLMEAFRKFYRQEKLRRYEASLFYINQAHYTLQLGQDLGLWDVKTLIQSLAEYEQIVRATSFHFIDKKVKTV